MLLLSAYLLSIVGFGRSPRRVIITSAQDEHGDHGLESPRHCVVAAGVEREQGRRLAAGRKLPTGLGARGLHAPPVSADG